MSFTIALDKMATQYWPIGLGNYQHDVDTMAVGDRIGRVLLLSLFYSCLRGARGARGGNLVGGRGSTRPAASTGSGVVNFRDATRARACACDVTHSLTRVYGKKFYYDVRLNSIHFSSKVWFS